MRIVYVIAMAVLMSPGYGKAQQKSDEGLACFEDLVAPEYPKAALQAHIDGTVWTTTQVNPQGGIGKIETQVVSAWADGPKLLTPPVEKAIRAAKIKSECAGKSVPVVFRYQLYGEAVPNPKVTSRTEKPNILWIESQPESVTEARSASSIKPQH